MKTIIAILALVFALNSWSGDKRIEQVIQSTKSGEPVFNVYGLGHSCSIRPQHQPAVCKCTLYRENGTVVPNCFLCSNANVYCSTDYLATPYIP